PPEEIYFFCPRNFENELNTNVSISDIRFQVGSVLSEEELTSWQQALEDVVQSTQVEESADRSDEGPVVSAESLVLSQDVRRRRILIRNDAHDSYQFGRKDWVSILSGLRQQLGLADSELDEFEDATIREGNPDSLIGYNMIGVFLDDIYELPQAVDAVKSDVNLKGEVDRVLAELVLQLESFSESKDMVSNSTCIVLAVLCFVSLLVVQILRFSSRRSEAAMLQVVGFTKKDLRRIVVVDSTIIWLYGILGSMLISMGAGRVIVWCQFDSALERGMAFQFEVMHHGCIALASLGIVLGSGIYASYKTWGQTSPADLFDN
ncbi:MAG: ABC transporter permease, partial [Planctomycetaceae bacterium]